MPNDLTKNPLLTDAAKAAVLGQGIIPKLKNSINAGDNPKDAKLEALKNKAQVTIEEIEKLVGGGNLDSATAQKLVAVLAKLRSAAHSGSISREALANVLSEAATMMTAAGGVGKTNTDATSEKLWQTIEACNKAIHDDFERMYGAGVVFDEKLWDKHKQLTEYMLTHPRDIEKQKELNQVDDQLLLQAESQISAHPEAKKYFEEAKKKSEDRHKTVDEDLAAIEKKTIQLDSNTDLDWGTPPSKEKPGATQKSLFHETTMNDVESQNVGQKPKIIGKNLGY